MTLVQEEALRRRLNGLPKASLAEAIIATTSRIGGTAALLSAMADAERQRSAQCSRRRVRQAGYRRSVQ